MQPIINNRMYDSDIFVMSNTTFDEDLASLSSRRVSANRKQAFKNEYLSFVENSHDIPTKNVDSDQLNGITS